MQKYRTIFANSDFTAEWIERRWGKKAEILYPPVDFDPPLAEKTNMIVSVGRITAERRSKNQLEQVRAFRDFAAGVQEAWTLRIIGSCGDDPQDQRYLAAVQAEAQGLPVEVWANVDRESTIRSLAEARIFWHTAGLSTDENKHPERAEHFGIATVEAMRAGCVPVVIQSGGQREIVEHAVGGLLAGDLPDLVRKSQTVARNVQLMTCLSEQSRQRSRAFDRHRFERRLISSVAQCVPV